MAIDNCQYSFQDLSRQVLPDHMVRMRNAMINPMKMAQFGVDGIGPKTILSRLGRKEDFAGCYVLLDKSRPIYVGISRSVVQRLLQHVKGKTHFDASLAYRIACKKHPHTMERSEVMNTPIFQREFQAAKNHLQSLAVAFIEIQNDLESYLFEVYCSMELDTHEWNTFRTH